MKIKPVVYEGLTPRQRIIAVIEAQARQDDQEIETLINTCPKKKYIWGDAEYCVAMQKLLIMALSVELDMRGHALGVMACLMKDHDAMEVFLQKMADTQAAWHEILETMGIDPETMRSAMAGLENPMVTILKEVMPDPEERVVAEIAEGMREFLQMETQAHLKNHGYDNGHQR